MNGTLLATIVMAVRERRYEVSLHIWTNYLNEPDRPLPSAIIYSIAEDAPKIVVDDPADSRGARAEIIGLSENGRSVYSHIGYGRNPMKLITAWHTTKATYDNAQSV